MIVAAMLLQALPLTFGQQTDPMTDRVLVGAMAVSDDSYILVGCERGREMRVWLSTRRLLRAPPGSIGYTFWLSRVGSQPPVTSPWEYDDPRMVHIDGNRVVAEFVRPMLAGGVLRLRLADIAGEPWDLTFDLGPAGPASAAIGQALDNCDAAGVRRRIAR